MVKAAQIIKSSRFLLCLACSVFFMLYTAHWIKSPLLQRIENVFYDLRIRSTVPNTFDDRIVIVDIDEKSIANEGQWPWSRNKLSFLVDILFDYYNIRLVAFDIVFSEADQSSGLQFLDKLMQQPLPDNEELETVLTSLRSKLDYDQQFAQSLTDRPVILSFFASHLDNPVNQNTNLPAPVGFSNSAPFADFLYHAKSYGANLNKLQTNAKSGGFFNNLTTDEDGVNRRIPLLLTYQNNIYEALSLAIYRELKDSAPIKFITGDNYGNDNKNQRLEKLQIQNYRIPVDEQGAILIPFRGKQGSFEYISATDILNAAIAPEKLQNKILIVGTTAAGLLDLRSTPVQNVYPGVEIHANIVSALLDQSIKSRPNFILGLELIELLVISFIVIHFFPRSSIGKVTLIFSALITLLFASNLILWKNYDIDSNFAIPFFLLCLLYVIQLFFGYFFETRRKKKLGEMFGQYIPPQLVEQMSQSDDHFSLKGENKSLSVLFSDIRGFTTISESLEPEELCELINEILTPITSIIHHNKGTIDKYIGDAVMAFWGAPLDDPEHASNAVKTALTILPELKNIQAEFNARGWPHIDIGIGINTGPMSVGNMGSQFRVAYTVMGDAVNLGSRLEGLTKHYGVKVIVSESTKEAAPEFVYVELDRVLVKGKKLPITIYEPIGLKENITQDQLDYLSQLKIAFSHYYEQQWDQANKLFKRLNSEHPHIVLHNLYIERIAYFKQNPPPIDWKGIFEHTTK